MINSNFGFTPLKEVWLGDCYPESFYDHLPNEIADPFRLITQWTKEDTGKLQKFLEDRGIVVRRPVFGAIENYLNNQDILTKPPVTPRDHYLVLGNSLYSLHNELKIDRWRYWLDYYRDQNFSVLEPIDQEINCLAPPSLVRVGRDLVIDKQTHENTWGIVSSWLVNISQEYRVNISNTDGHSDGVFCPVGPELIVTSHYKKNYKESFPGWEVFHIPPKLTNLKEFKNWTANDNTIDGNQSFNHYIQKNASDWVGNFNETVFEVNMLVIDEHNVVAMKDYPPLRKWLEEKDITLHCFDLRTRSFWDGGWHCFTLDIQRADSKLDLFPNRGPNGVFWTLE